MAGIDWTRTAPGDVVTAPDGSQVCPLVAGGHASLAHGRLPAGAVSLAIRHRTVEELWHVLSGGGALWRRLGAEEDVVQLTAGVSVRIPAGTVFQFRADAAAPLVFLMATTPAWPGDGEAVPESGPWTPAPDGEG